MTVSQRQIGPYEIVKCFLPQLFQQGISTPLSTAVLEGVQDKLDSNPHGASASDNPLKVALERPEGFFPKLSVCSLKALVFISSKILCNMDQE